MDDRAPQNHGSGSPDWVRPFYNQTAVWWGPNTNTEAYIAQARQVERLCGPGPHRILDLGTGPGGNAAALADRGHQVVAVEVSERVRYARELTKAPRKGSLTVLQADFFTLELAGRFDVVTCWQVFGVGSDRDQRHLLQRIARHWLAPGGAVLMDVYCPFRPAREAGNTEVLPPLPSVPGSVEMTERCHFDPVQCRWIDEWEPTASPHQTMAQTLRCYSPADLMLLLQGTGLALTRLEVDGREVDMGPGIVTRSGPLMEAWSYVVTLRQAGEIEQDRGAESA
jgi:SAM-dependent methyltransferase